MADLRAGYMAGMENAVAGGLLLLTYIIVAIALIRQRRTIQVDGRDRPMTEWAGERDVLGDDLGDDPKEDPDDDLMDDLEDDPQTAPAAGP